MVLLAVLFFLFMFAGMPIAFGIGIAGFSFFATSQFIPVSIGVQQVAAMSQSFPLLAVPLFVLAGHMMNKTGITERLIGCSNVLVAWMSGGLAQVCILLSTFMGGVSGSAVADAAMEARVLGPSMIKSGYSRGFTCASIAVGSLITATIPPSLGLILYGFVGNVSIGRLFLAGVVPGILMMIAMMFTVWLVARKRGYSAADAVPPTLPRVGRAVWHAKWALLFPVALLFAIRSGVFTPSEVGAFAVVYAVVIGTFVHRDLTWASFNEALSESVQDIGVITLIILLSGMVGYAIVFEQAPQTIAQVMLGLSSQPVVVVFMILVFIFICGLFVEATVMTLLLTPIFVPIITKLGMDPVHFGVLMMSIITLGGMTPPVGVAMYAVCSILDCPVEEYLKESLPFLVAILIVIAVLVLLPGLVLFLPNLLM
ncbi:TRAP transporter large permease [Consotaella salsifontis]|uniref:TRAP transporter large permease protein n=1 Tax=Consotaella salsifontis TaxID=1365950 RepID=A0A1T4MSC0_9HYPH|nr:TRAP transporter large permease [Consotaella salsifontis]SJZ69959.1 TRAP transporter, DctM subunit [Consotaella salsifontis]